MFGPTCGQERFRRAPVRQRRPTALPDQIKRVHIGTQTESFTHIVGESGTQIAGAGAYDYGVHFEGSKSGIGKGAFGGFGGEQGRVPGEAGV